MKKVVFLDFDGVMVTSRYQAQLIATGQLIRDSHGALFDPLCVACLKQVIDSTNAEIVVTSTWKMEMGLEGIRQMWYNRNLSGKVVGVTPDIDPIHRGNEVAAWLDSSDEDCFYAIIDDTPMIDFFREEQLPNLFQVDESLGLNEVTAMQVIEHLNGKELNCIEKMTLENRFYEQDKLDQLLYEHKIDCLDYVTHHSEERVKDFKDYCERRGVPENEESAGNYMNFLIRDEEKSHTEGLD